jgi:hypothetical protein
VRTRSRRARPGETATAELQVIRAFLVQRGAGCLQHPGGTLYEHVSRVADLLADWGASEEVRAAGLCHACYGTDGYAPALLSLADRPVLAAVDGRLAGLEPAGRPPARATLKRVRQLRATDLSRLVSPTSEPLETPGRFTTAQTATASCDLSVIDPVRPRANLACKRGRVPEPLRGDRCDRNDLQRQDRCADCGRPGGDHRAR